jgi:hypothetical protein
LDKLVTSYQTKMIARALGRLSGAASKAVYTLVVCLKSKESDSVRVRAALGILDQLIKMCAFDNIEERLAELERRIGSNAPSLNGSR